MTKRGCPLKLKEPVKKSLFGSLALGMSYADSSLIAGISYATFNRWMNLGKEEKQGKFFNFFNEVKRAVAIGKAQNVKKIKDDDSWQSKAWLLERQHPAEYGRKDKVDVTSGGEELKPMNFNIIRKDD